MNSGVCGVDELTRNETVRNLFCKFLRFCYRAFHAFISGRKHKFRSVSLHQLTSFNGHRFGHNYDYSVSSCRRHACKTYAGIARGRFNDDGTFFQKPLLFRVIYHPLCDSVLDGTRGIEIFEFCENFCFESVFFFYMCKFKQRGFTYKLIRRGINTSHDVLTPLFLLFDRRKRRVKRSDKVVDVFCTYRKSYGVGFDSLVEKFVFRQLRMGG